MIPKPEASLRDWWFSGVRAHGHVKGHPRFPDGAYIHTSTIMRFNKKLGVIETLNTFYRLEGWNLESEESHESSELERRLGKSMPDVPKDAQPLRKRE